jgi:hypothetical protein
VYWPEPGSNLNQLQVGVARQIRELSLRRGSWGSLVVKLAITVSVSHVRLRMATREEDLAGDLALDRIKPRASASAVDEGEPLVGEISVRHVVVPDLGLPMGAGVDCALADVADEAETEAFRGDERSRHCQEMSRWIDEMRVGERQDKARLCLNPGETGTILIPRRYRPGRLRRIFLEMLQNTPVHHASMTTRVEWKAGSSRRFPSDLALFLTPAPLWMLIAVRTRCCSNTVST